MTYYIARDGQRLGPFSEEQIRQGLAQGTYSASDLAWCEGLTDWAALETILPAEAAAPQASAPKPTSSTPAPSSRKSSRKASKKKPGLQRIALIACCIIFGLLAVGAITLYSVASYYGTAYDKSSKAYVDEALPAIVKVWSTDELLKRAAPEFRDTVQADKVETLFLHLADLGALQNYQGAQGQSNMAYHRSTGLIVSAVYTANLTFEHGTAKFAIALLRVDDQWKIAGFHVDPPVFNNK